MTWRRIRVWPFKTKWSIDHLSAFWLPLSLSIATATNPFPPPLLSAWLLANHIFSLFQNPLPKSKEQQYPQGKFNVIVLVCENPIPFSWSTFSLQLESNGIFYLFIYMFCVSKKNQEFFYSFFLDSNKMGSFFTDLLCLSLSISLVETKRDRTLSSSVLFRLTLTSVILVSNYIKHLTLSFSLHQCSWISSLVVLG